MKKIAPVLYKCISITPTPKEVCPRVLSKAFFSSLQKTEQMSKSRYHNMYYNPLVECETTRKYVATECLSDTIEELEIKLLHKTSENKYLIDKIENLEKNALDNKENSQEPAEENVKKHNMDIIPVIITVVALATCFW